MAVGELSGVEREHHGNALIPIGGKLPHCAAHKSLGSFCKSRHRLVLLGLVVHCFFKLLTVIYPFTTAWSDSR